MKKVLLFLLIATVGIAAGACKSTKDSQQAEDNTLAMQNFRIVVDVYSDEEGINEKAIPLFEKFIYDYEGDMGIAVGYSELKYGVNGATRFCIPLDDIDAELVEDFIRRLKKTLEGLEKVKIEENVPCAPSYKK